jgi:hypothetical protein
MARIDKSYVPVKFPPKAEPAQVLKNCSDPDFPPHQEHTLPHVHDTVSDHIAYGGGGKHTISGHGFLCKDVIEMEMKFGRHAEGCAHVGYINAKTCGCVK